MKAFSLYVSLISLALAVAALPVLAQEEDDIYATPKQREQSLRKQQEQAQARRTQQARTTITTRTTSENLDKNLDEGDVYDEEGYEYTNRLRRFNQPWAYQGGYFGTPAWAWGYYDPFWGPAYNPYAFGAFGPAWGSGWSLGWNSWSGISFGFGFGSAWGYNPWGYGFGNPYWCPPAYGYGYYGAPVVVVPEYRYNLPRGGSYSTYGTSSTRYYRAPISSTRSGVTRPTGSGSTAPRSTVGTGTSSTYSGSRGVKGSTTGTSTRSTGSSTPTNNYRPSTPRPSTGSSYRPSYSGGGGGGSRPSSGVRSPR